MCLLLSKSSLNRLLAQIGARYIHRAIVYQYNRNKRGRWSKIIYEFVYKYVRDPQDKFIYSFESHMDYNSFVSIVQLKLKR